MNAIDHFVMDITSAKAIARYAAAVRTVSSYRAYGSSRPLNEGNTQDQFACRCRRCIGHGQRDWSLGYWGRATVSADDRIAAWLEEVGLGQYATVFAENAIDLDVLPDVTETDLEKWVSRSAIENGFSERSLRCQARQRLPPRRPRLFPCRNPRPRGAS